MILKKKVTISWSGGKDSAFALYKILASGEFEVINLHTVIDQDSKRVGLHGVRESLIEKQAEQSDCLSKKFIYLLPTTMRCINQPCKTFIVHALATASKVLYLEIYFWKT